MKIGIDITTLAYQGFGVTNYTYNLVKNLLTIDKKNTYHLFYSSFKESKNSEYLKEFKELGAIVHEYRIPLVVFEYLWSKLNVIPVEYFIGKMDILYFSDFLRPPLLKGTKGVTTVHDLVWKIYPEFHEDWIVRSHEIKLKKTIKNSDLIITDSESTKNDLIKYFPEIDQTKITVIYPGISEINLVSDKNKIESVIKKYISKYSILNTRYLLSVGSIEPRKNLSLTIEVFHKLIYEEIASSPSTSRDDKSLRAQRSNPYKDYKLIVVGKTGWKNEEVFKKIKELGLEDKIIFAGFVNDEDLPYFYSGAELTVYLSAYEGFGLPPLESLACGTPVLAGDNSSMKETIDKQFLVNISNKEKVLEKMKYLLENKIQINSEEVKKRFNWQDSARKFLKLI